MTRLQNINGRSRAIVKLIPGTRRGKPRPMDLNTGCTLTSGTATKRALKNDKTIHANDLFPFVSELQPAR